MSCWRENCLEYACEQGYQFNLIATEDGRDVFRLGFTTTTCGGFQSIPELGSFNLAGDRMRRLRYQVERYKKAGRLHHERVRRRERPS